MNRLITFIQRNAVAIASVLAIATAIDTVVLVHSEVATHRTAQDLCHLVVATHDDKQRRYDNTKVYLSLPVGKQHTGLNDYIRKVSLPQTRAEILAEKKRLPKC